MADMEYQSLLVEKENSYDKLRNKEDENIEKIQKVVKEKRSKGSKSSSSSSDNSDSSKKRTKKKWIAKKRELEMEVTELKSRLEEEASMSDHLRIQLREETDAKERVQSNLNELQVKHDNTLKEEELLRCLVNEKEELLQNLKKENKELIESMEKENQRKHSLTLLSKIKNSEKNVRPNSYTSVNKPKIHVEKVDSSESDSNNNTDSDSDHDEEIPPTQNNDEDSLKEIGDVTEHNKSDIINQILNEFNDSTYLMKDELNDFVTVFQEKQFASFIQTIDHLKDDIADLRCEHKKEAEQFNNTVADLKTKHEEELVYIKSKYDNEIDEWKVKNEELNVLYEKEKELFDQETEDKIKHRVEDKVKNRLKEVEQTVSDQAEMQSKIELLESDKVTLQKFFDEEQKKYTEVLITLQEVQDAYGDMRDVVLERYKNQVVELQEKVRVAEETNNENTITELRQKVLDARLSIERVRQNNEEEVALYKEKDQNMKVDLNKFQQEIENLHQEKYKLQNTVSDLKTTIDLLRDEVTATSEKLIELSKQNSAIEASLQVSQQTIGNKDNQIIDLTNQVASQQETVVQITAEKKLITKELEDVENLKEDIDRLSDHVEDLKNQVKLKNVKAKYLKKQVKELLDHKQKFDTLAEVLPEMQKQIDQLQTDKNALKKSIAERKLQEAEEKLKIEQDKKAEEQRKQKLKEDWERSILGIGDCALHHEGTSEFTIKSESFQSRPGSAPISKPRPPSSRRSSYGTKKNINNRLSQMNSTFPNYYPIQPGRIYDKRNRNENAYHLKKNNFFRSATLPMNHLNSIKREDFPKLSRSISSSRSNDVTSPRVLVWNNDDNHNDSEGKGNNKLLAIGDKVAANITRQCSSHGSSSLEQCGVVKFIGFISGNHENVYIGIRLDDEVGNTDGFVDGKRYFRCEQNRGKFVRYEDIIKVLETKTLHVPLK